MSTNLYRLEADDATIGAVAFKFPSGKCKSAQWRSTERIADTLALAKDCTARVLAQLMEEGAEADIRETNWASCTAAVQKHIQDWNNLRPAILAP